MERTRNGYTVDSLQIALTEVTNRPFFLNIATFKTKFNGSVSSLIVNIFIGHRATRRIRQMAFYKYEPFESVPRFKSHLNYKDKSFFQILNSLRVDKEFYTFPVYCPRQTCIFSTVKLAFSTQTFLHCTKARIIDATLYHR